MNKVQFSRDFLKLGYIFIVFILSACNTINVESSTATLPPPTYTKTPAPTVTPSPTTTAVFEGFGLTPELVKAFKNHTGLESSIIQESGGQYSTTVTLFSTDSQPITQSMYVIPSTLYEDIESKNKFGNTPTIQTADGNKLYWVQEEQGWFAVDISTDINKPVFVPFDQRVVATRVIIAEFNQPFSQEAIDRWKVSPGIAMQFLYLTVNFNTGESTKAGLLENLSMNLPDLTNMNSPIQVVNAWFTTQLPDGTKYQFFPTKWLDPSSTNDLEGDEWKIIWCASGQEMMGDQGNRDKFLNLLSMEYDTGQHPQVTPIFRVQNGFFNDTNGLITLFAAQSSLQKLLEVPENTMDNLPNPGWDETPYKKTFDLHFPNLSPTNSSFIVGISKDDLKYHGFFPAEIQTLIFPSMIIFH